MGKRRRKAIPRTIPGVGVTNATGYALTVPTATGPEVLAPGASAFLAFVEMHTAPQVAQAIHIGLFKGQSTGRLTVFASAATLH